MTGLRDVGLQVALALALSLMFWTFVTFRTNPDVRRTYGNIPVMARGLGPNLVIVDESGTPRQGSLTNVSVAVETDQETLSNLNQADLQAQVDLSGLSSGTHAVTVIPLSTRRNITFSSIEPSSLPIQIERVITRTVPITIEVEGTLPFSYERGDPEMSVNNQPVEKAEVSGPQSQVERVAVALATVAVDQVRATYVSTLPLQPLNANGDVVEGVNLQPGQVRVRIPVTSVVGLKRVPVLGNVIGSPALGYVVTGVQSEPPLISLVGSSRVLDGIDQVETAPIDISGTVSTITREVPIRFGQAQPQEGEPRWATVTVQIASLDQPFQVRVGVPIQVVGAPETWLVEVDPQIAQLQLEGSTSALAQLNANSLVGMVDVAGRGSGSYRVEPELNLPTDVRVVGDVPEVVVTLQSPATPSLVPSPLPTSTPTVEPATETPEPSPTSSDVPTDTPEPLPTPTDEPVDELTPTLESEVPTEPGVTPTLEPEPAEEPPATATPEPSTPAEPGIMPTPGEGSPPLHESPPDQWPIGTLPDEQLVPTPAMNTSGTMPVQS